MDNINNEQLNNLQELPSTQVSTPTYNHGFTPRQFQISPFVTVVITIVIMLSLGSAGFFGYKYYSLKQQLETNKTDVANPVTTDKKADGVQEATKAEKQVSEQTFTHEKYPKLKIKYDSTWTLTSQEKAGNTGTDAKDLTVTLKKQSTTLTYNLEVGTPMGGSPNCYDNEYTVISDKLVRIKNYNNLGDLYWAGEAFGTKFNTQKMSELEKAAPDAFDCQKTNNCICQVTMDNETFVIGTSYPTPADYPVEQQKTFGALMKVYVKQTQPDEQVLTEADQIVETSVEAL